MAATRHYLLVGLGNYTHPNTRHSIGQNLLHSFLSRASAPRPAIWSLDRSLPGWTASVELPISALVSASPPSKKRKRAPLPANKNGEGAVAPPSPPPPPPPEERIRLTLLKPRLLMNISGSAVHKAVRQCFLDGKPFAQQNREAVARRVIVIHDDLGRDPGKVSTKFSGSPSGHNGLRSTISSLGTPAFHRIRVGIGKPPGVNVSDYVLGPLSLDELHMCEEGGVVMQKVWDEIGKIVKADGVVKKS